MVAEARLRPFLPPLLLGLAALAVTALTLAARMPLAQIPEALLAPNTSDIRQMLLRYSYAPRLVTGLLCGAGLGLAGVLLQTSLRNPLASPSTLGVSAGANLALAAATLWAPGLLAPGREWVALAGGLLAALAVLALSWHRRLNPLTVVLAGMVVSLYCGALAALLALFETHYLAGLFIWGGGSLSQQDWSAAAFLAPRLAAAALGAALLLRPLALLTLDDAQARSLGVPVSLVRLAALGLGVAIAACVVSAVGVIGFIGLAAPALATAAGARRLGPRLLVAALTGATLLWLTDQCVLLLAGAAGDMVPTGAVTALFGTPLLLWLLARPGRLGLALPTPGEAVARRAAPRRLLLLAAGLILLLGLSLTLGPGLEGWRFAPAEALEGLLPWRAPRALAALSAGAMLAAAGSLLQRATGNPMASPEVLGVSAGAAFGLVAVMFLLGESGRMVQLGGAAAGAGLALAAILALGRPGRGPPERVLLAGIALGAMFDAVVTALLASGDPRAALLLNWMTGSTYGIGWPEALAGLGLALIGAAALPLLARWLDIVPLGRDMSAALGLSPRLGQGGVLLAAAALGAAATLIVGPLTFVGLLGPHLARRLGLQRALPEVAGAALAGALVMVAADGMGRSIAFPWQIPAGLAATFIGCPALMWLLARRPHA